jgi:hypothetical protein
MHRPTFHHFPHFSQFPLFTLFTLFPPMHSLVCNLHWPDDRYVTDDNDRFRGPVYCLYRFMSGYYVFIDVRRTVYEDYRITLKSPSDGRFAMHAYGGKDIVIDLSRYEIIGLYSYDFYDFSSLTLTISNSNVITGIYCP